MEMDQRGSFGRTGTTVAEFSAPFLEHAWCDSAPTAITTLGDTVLTLERCGTVRRDGVPVSTLDRPSGFLHQVGPTVVAGGRSGTLFDALSGRPLYRHRSALTSAATFADHIAIGTSTGEAVVLTASSFQPVTTVTPPGSPLIDLAVANGVVLTLTADGSVTWWDMTTGERLGHKHDVHANACIALPDNRFATVGAELRLWSESEATTVQSPHVLATLAVTTDGMFIATGSPTGPLALYDLPTRDWLTTPITGVAALHRSGNHFIACTTDGRLHEISPHALLDGVVPRSAPG
ncbi:WD40 repeat domain-containing protein [Actinokineospora terrae]|nr:hypothetical protein [Actinokineospora terrae]